jgi:hypothetical protein
VKYLLLFVCLHKKHFGFDWANFDGVSSKHGTGIFYPTPWPAVAILQVSEEQRKSFGIKNSSHFA